jgi:hypothetical protein
MKTERPEIALLRHQAESIHRRVRSNLEGMTQAESLVNPEPAGNNANWVLGHLVKIYDRALVNMGEEPVMPEGALDRYVQGSPPLQDPAEALELMDLLKAWDESSERIDKALQSLSPEKMERQGQYYSRSRETTTLGRYLSVLMFHQAYHSGQLGLLRRIAGKEGAVP